MIKTLTNHKRNDNLETLCPARLSFRMYVAGPLCTARSGGKQERRQLSQEQVRKSCSIERIEREAFMKQNIGACARQCLSARFEVGSIGPDAEIEPPIQKKVNDLYTNQLELRVIGMSRSGNHAIIQRTGWGKSMTSIRILMHNGPL
jgi:hypothetical protein